MNDYQKRKAQAREEAQQWQTSDAAISWHEVATACAYFQKLGKRCGLLKEFRENGII